MPISGFGERGIRRQVLTAPGSAPPPRNETHPKHRVGGVPQLQDKRGQGAFLGKTSQPKETKQRFHKKCIICICVTKLAFQNGIPAPP